MCHPRPRTRRATTPRQRPIQRLRALPSPPRPGRLASSLSSCAPGEMVPPPEGGLEKDDRCEEGRSEAVEEAVVMAAAACDGGRGEQQRRRRRRWPAAGRGAAAAAGAFGVDSRCLTGSAQAMLGQARSWPGDAKGWRGRGGGSCLVEGKRVPAVEGSKSLATRGRDERLRASWTTAPARCGPAGTTVTLDATALAGRPGGQMESKASRKASAAGAVESPWAEH